MKKPTRPEGITDPYLLDLMDQVEAGTESAYLADERISACYAGTVNDQADRVSTYLLDLFDWYTR